MPKRSGSPDYEVFASKGRRNSTGTLEMPERPSLSPNLKNYKDEPHIKIQDNKHNPGKGSATVKS